MKLRNLYKENTNYVRDMKTAILRKFDTIPKEDKLYDWLIEFRVQKCNIDNRLMIVVAKTPDCVLSFAESELLNIGRLLDNSIRGTEKMTYCQYWGVSEYVDYANATTWEVDVVKRYKQHLETIIADKGILETDTLLPDDEEVIKFKTIFSKLEHFKNNLVIEYSCIDREFKEDTCVEYKVLSVAGCNDPNTFQNAMAHHAELGVVNLRQKVNKLKPADKKMFIADIKQWLYEYKEIIQDGQFINARYKGKYGWQVALDKNLQDNIQAKVKGFISTWDSGISELIQKLLIIETGIPEINNKPVSDILNLSFNYLSYKRENEIEKIYAFLKSNYFIDNITTKPNFRNVFVGKPVKDKINWIGNKNTLNYFIKLLVNKGKIDKNVDYWKITATCFLDNGQIIIREKIKDDHRLTEAKKEILKEIFDLI